MLSTVRQALPHEYSKYRTHLKSLDVESRNLRFAHPISDEVIDNLCDEWEQNPTKHVLFIIENDQLDFVAVGHIALFESMELAFSVLKEYRGQGMGDKLMDRCIQYCRTHNILHGHMTCLSHNAVIKHLCVKHGIHIHTEYGETLADIDLDAANLNTYLHEVADRQIAFVDYVAKRSRLPWTFVQKSLTSNT